LGTQPRQLVAGRNRRFGNHLCPHHQGSDVMMGTEMVLEMSVSSCNQLTRLRAREDFIEFSRRESFKLYKIGECLKKSVADVNDVNISYYATVLDGEPYF
jgi:hypothetical protein